MWRLAALALTACCAAACSPAAPAGTPVGTAPAATVTLEAGAPSEGGPPTLVVPRDAAQVGLLLRGSLGEIDHLTAEVAPVASPDDARRWRVDAAIPGADDVRAMVTLPSYALPTGDYVLTLWEGDARVVARFAFRSRKD